MRLLLLAMLLGLPAQVESVSTSALRITAATLTASEAAGGPGTVVLEMAEAAADDPEDVVRVQAVLLGPLPASDSDDDSEIYALSALLRFPAQRLSFVAGSLTKGELLGRDGRDTLITGGVTTAAETQLTIGASRIGAVPGIQAPRGRSILFSLALRVLAPGEIPITWGDSAFIDANVRATGAPQFVDATLHIEGIEVRETQEH